MLSETTVSEQTKWIDKNKRLQGINANVLRLIPHLLLTSNKARDNLYPGSKILFLYTTQHNHFGESRANTGHFELVQQHYE